jgi:hypothetical protein
MADVQAGKPQSDAIHGISQIRFSDFIDQVTIAVASFHQWVKTQRSEIYAKRIIQNY